MIISFETIAVLASIVVFSAAIPGPDFLYISSNALSGGLRKSLAAWVGIIIGLLIYVTATAAGLSALFLYLPLLYSLVQWLGVVYLAYIAFCFFKSAWQGDDFKIASVPKKSAFEIIRGGILINLLNPKTTLFFTAFLPQFIDKNVGHVSLQFLILGLLSVSIGSAIYLGVAIAFSKMGTGFQNKKLTFKNHGIRQWLEFSAGLLYSGFALTLAFWRK